MVIENLLHFEENVHLTKVISIGSLLFQMENSYIFNFRKKNAAYLILFTILYLCDYIKCKIN